MTKSFPLTFQTTFEKSGEDLYIIVSAMTQFSHFSLYKKFRCSAKDDDDLFNIHYRLTDEFQSPRHDDDKSEKDTASIENKQKKVLPVPVFQNIHKKKLNDLKNYSKKMNFKPKRKQSKQVVATGGSHPKEVQTAKKESTPQKQIKKQKEEEIIVEKQEEEKKVKKYRSRYMMMEKLVGDQSEQLGELVLKSQRSKSTEHREIWPEVEEAKKKPLRKLYDDYLDEDVIEQSRQNGEKVYFKGRVEFGEDTKWFAKIISEEFEGILVVQGRHRNRCMHEDEVYFKIIEEKKQKILCDIVGIAARRSRQIVGKVEFIKSKNIYLLRPINLRIESMNLNLNEIKKEWLQDIHSRYFLAEFKEWEVTAEYPSCRIIDQYGPCGQIEIQTKALLKTHGVEERPYNPQEIQDILSPFKHNLTADGEFIVSEEQLSKRKDFRKHSCFIVRENTFDAAYSIRTYQSPPTADKNFLKKQIFQIDVHFVDVNYFVAENSAFDAELLKRNVSYNLIHRVIPLLPQPLNEKICRLKVGRDTLTFSVCLKIDQQGNIIDIGEIHRSVITPKSVFSFNQLLSIINDQVTEEQWQEQDSGCKSKAQFKTSILAVKLLAKVMAKCRAKRIQSGGLIFQIPSKCFKLDQHCSPQQLEIKLKTLANQMIQECIIIASFKVGQYLYKNLKQKAILFRHKFPGFKRLGRFKQLLKKVGQPLQQTDSNEVQKNINNLVLTGTIKQCIKDLIRYETIRLLQGSDYFEALNSDPISWVHYAINMPIYTHCSTPTQRYADLLIQRQIACIIDKKPWTLEDSTLQKVLQACNHGKFLLNRVENGCEKIMLCVYLRTNPIVTTAILTSVQSWGIKICLPNYNFKSSITFSKLKTTKVTKFDTDPTFRKYVKLDFRSEDGAITTKFVLKELQQIHVQIRSSNSFPLDYAVTLVMPHPTDPQQHLVIS